MGGQAAGPQPSGAETVGSQLRLAAASLDSPKKLKGYLTEETCVTTLMLDSCSFNKQKTPRVRS